MYRRRKLISVLCIIALVLTTVMSTVTFSFGASAKSKYWIKVNAQANVVTVYKKSDGKWKPYRAMLCSCGTGKKGSGEDTPTGTYYVQSRWEWLQMVGGVYGRYVVQFYGDFLFHSVPYEEYGDLDSMPAKEFNKLGRDASHGCVRLSIMDSKWVYNNIPRGTKVTVYNSKNPGPLGKPTWIKLPKKPKLTWDPTDPSKKNKNYQLPKPVIKVSSKKKLEIQQGTTYKLKSGVTAQDPNTFQDLTSQLTVYKIKKYDTAKKKYVSADFSTKKLATYKITYRVKYKYGGTTYKTIKLKIVDNLKAPTISGAKNKTVTWGDVNAVNGITAKQRDCTRTSAIKVSIKAPGASESVTYTYAEAKQYQFTKVGKYQVKYTVKNKYKPYKSTTKTVTITSAKKAVNEAPVLTIPADLSSVAASKGDTLNLISGVTAKHNGCDVTKEIKYAVRKPDALNFVEYRVSELKSFVVDKAGDYEVLYSVTNQYTPHQTVYKSVRIFAGE